MNYCKLRHVFCMFLLLCSVLSFSSCDEDLINGNPTRYKLKGTWTVEEVIGEEEYKIVEKGDKFILKSNSTFEIKGKKYTMEGKWNGAAEEVRFDVKDENGKLDGLPDYIGFISELNEHVLKMYLRIGPGMGCSLELKK